MVRILSIRSKTERIRLSDAAEKLPPSFMLQLDSGETHFCRVSWRDGERMGVKFIDQVA